MCGIAGWLGSRLSEPREDIVARILTEQDRRGPDHRGMRVFSGATHHAVLGHNRLAIIDLTAAANQPMQHGAGHHWLTFNGEIYNYLELRDELSALGDRFATTSDTEVLIAAWERYGVRALDRCNGMFAFAMYDEATGELWLVRDRFGVKPVYYAVEGGAFVFASSPGAVARCCGKSPNLSYAARGGAVGIYDDDGDISPYAGVRAVPAGHVLKVECHDGRIALDLWRYYDLEASVADARERLARTPIPSLLAEARALLEGAVSLRLRSDVPVGLSLSGGVDSSSVAALASRHGNLVGFSFGDPSESRSEGPVVAVVASQVGIPVRYVSSAHAHVLADLFDATLAAQDAPFPGCSIIAQFAVCQRARAEGVKVLLGGQGGDEAFMGYHKFRGFRSRELVARGDLAGALRVAWGGLRAISASRFTASSVRRQIARYRRDPRASGVLGTISTAPVPALGYDPQQPLWRRQLRDVTALSLPTLLRYEDRNSMGNSIETRLPFVDFRVVEFGLALPESVKIREGFGKWILREAMAECLPDRVRWSRGKRGFDADQPYAIASGLGAVIRERFNEVSSRLRDVIPAVSLTATEYSDKRLVKDPTAMAEATTLIWLGQRLAGTDFRRGA